MRNSGVKIIIKETGKEFNSIIECAKFLGVNATWLGKVTRGSGLYTCHGYHIIRVDETNPDYIYNTDRDSYRGRAGVKVKIIETGEIFDSASDCAKAINGSAGTILDIIHNKRGRTSHKGYHFEGI